MRCLIQRVNSAKVVFKEGIASIGKGFCVFLAVSENDCENDVNYCANKLVNLRIMPDKNHDMNKNITESKGEILLISQFTLYADCKKGNRPSFTSAAEANKAIKLYELMASKLRNLGVKVREGKFGAYMKVSLENDGPVTIILNSPDK